MKINRRLDSEHSGGPYEGPSFTAFHDVHGDRTHFGGASGGWPGGFNRGGGFASFDRFSRGQRYVEFPNIYEQTGSGGMQDGGNHGPRRQHHHEHHGRHHRRHHSEHDHGSGNRRRGGDHSEQFENGAYDNVQKPASSTLASSVQTVVKVAREMGLNDRTIHAAVAAMLIESKGNPRAVGDHGTSFGLFQLHRGGELTEALKQGKLHSAQEAFDPEKNARVALEYFKKLENRIHDPGALAAAAQRPLHRGQYARKVQSMMATADALIQQYGAA